MYILLIIVHIFVCIVLISVILLQAGRGGGLTEMFGGDTAQSLLGTQAPVLLKRATEVCAMMFLVTSLVLGMVTARRGRSLFEGARFDVPKGADRQGIPPVVTPKAVETETVPLAPEVPEAQEAPVPAEARETAEEAAPDQAR